MAGLLASFTVLSLTRRIVELAASFFAGLFAGLALVFVLVFAFATGAALPRPPGGHVP